MKLRQWQAECINLAYQQYLSDNTHFMCLATPGSGKTMAASRLAKQLFDGNHIDLVICLSPSLIVAGDFKEELETQTGKRLDGKLGANGCSLTYQAMLALNDEFWELLADFRVFVIFDEIHHCAGGDLHNANAWGERIISEIQGKASFTLALTGTPWRSDKVPIALAKYCEDQHIHCDYSYGLNQAITDGVCRRPKITLIDNDKISLKQGDDTNHYNSFADLLEKSDCSYQDLVESEALMTYMIRKANNKLDQLRKIAPDAGGLIVATSVAHARQIYHLLETKFNENADIATYQEDDPLSIIKKYKHSTNKWIISVGMISEGTNIPRLHVCCHLTRVKTELHFRQVLGRILRVNSVLAEEGFLYISAESTLIEYAHRVAEDIPKENIVDFDYMQSSAPENRVKPVIHPLNKKKHELSFNDVAANDPISKKQINSDSILSRSYEATLNIFGRFICEELSYNEQVIRFR